MALLHTGDRICASCGGMNGKHRPGCIGDESDRSDQHLHPLMWSST